MKVAFFSPLNPKRSGISDYSEELLPHLAESVEITLFVDGYKPTNPAIVRQFPIHDYSADPSHIRRLNEFDIALYHMGNDHRYHSGILDSALKHPGVIVLHDFALHDFFLGLSRHRRDPNVYLNEVEAGHGSQMRAEAEKALAVGIPLGADRPLEFPLNYRLARSAEGIIVHSEWSRTRLENIAAGVPVTRVPMPVKPSPVLANYSENGSSSKRVEIASFGLVIPGKGIDQILRTLSALKASYNFHYTLVGGENPYFNVRSLIQEYDIADRVTITGHVSLDEFERYIASTDIAINLRERTVGETSASLCRIMAAGVPVIVSNVGSFSEFPDDTVIKVDNDRVSERMLRAFLGKLMDDPQLRRRIGANALNHIRTEHDIKVSARMYVDFMESIVASRTRRKLVASVSHEIRELEVKPTDLTLLTSVANELANVTPPATIETVQLESEATSTTIESRSSSVFDRSSSENGRLAKIEGISYKQAAIDYPNKLDPERHHYLFTKPFYNLANKPLKHLGDGMDAETFRHFCDFANIAVHLALPAGAKILDVGCGSGWLSEYFARLGYDVTGIDISPSLIEIAEERIKAQRFDVDHETAMRCSFKVHDVELEPLDERFDAIVCYDSLHHFENEMNVITNLAQMTVYGGMVFILEGDRPPIGSATEQELIGVMEQYETLESPFTRSYLRDLLDRNGLLVIGDYVSINGLFERDDFETNELRLQPPEVNYLLCKKVVKEDRVPASSLPDSRNAQGLSATITTDDWPQKVNAGSVIKCKLEIENSGEALWLVGSAGRRGSVMLGIKIIDSYQRVVFERHGTPPLPRALASGEKVQLRLELPAPDLPGNYTISFDMVAQHVCWFESDGSQPLVLSIAVE